MLTFCRFKPPFLVSMSLNRAMFYLPSAKFWTRRGHRRLPFSSSPPPPPPGLDMPSFLPRVRRVKLSRCSSICSSSFAYSRRLWEIPARAVHKQCSTILLLSIYIHIYADFIAWLLCTHTLKSGTNAKLFFYSFRPRVRCCPCIYTSSKSLKTKPIPIFRSQQMTPINN